MNKFEKMAEEFFVDWPPGFVVREDEEKLAQLLEQAAMDGARAVIEQYDAKGRGYQIVGADSDGVAWIDDEDSCGEDWLRKRVRGEQ